MDKALYDMNQAIALLATMKHWTLQSENRNGQREGYSCTIWNDGRRVTAWTKGMPLAAVQIAFDKLRDKSQDTGLKVVR